MSVFSVPPDQEWSPQEVFITSQDSFSTFKSDLSKQAYQVLFPHQVHWAKIVIRNQLDNFSFYNWKFYFGSSNSITDTIEVYYFLEDGTLLNTSPILTGDLVPNKSKQILPANQYPRVPFNLEAGSSITALVKFVSARQHPLNPRFELRRTEMFGEWDEVVFQRIITLLFGFILTMTFFHLIMAVAANDKAFLYYGLYLLGVAVFFSIPTTCSSMWI